MVFMMLMVLGGGRMLLQVFKARYNDIILSTGRVSLGRPLKINVYSQTSQI